MDSDIRSGCKSYATIFSVFQSRLAGVGVTVPNVDLSNNQVAFSTYHKFNNGEEAFTEHLTKPIGGISTDSRYFLKVIDANKVSIHNSLGDVVSGINSLSLNSLELEIMPLKVF